MTDEKGFNRTEAKRVLLEAAANCPSHDKDISKIEFELHERSKSSQEYWNYIYSYIMRYFDPNLQTNQLQDSQNISKSVPSRINIPEDVLLQPSQAEKQNMAGPILNQTVTAPHEKQLHQKLMPKSLQSTKKIESHQQIQQSIMKLTPDQNLLKSDGKLSQLQSKSQIQQNITSGSLQITKGITKGIAKNIKGKQQVKSMQSTIARHSRSDQIFTKTGTLGQPKSVQVQQQKLSAPVQSQNTIKDLNQPQQSQDQGMLDTITVNNLLLNENGNNRTLQFTNEHHTNNQADIDREAITTGVKSKIDQDTAEQNKRVKNAKKIGRHSNNSVKKKFKSSDTEDVGELNRTLSEIISIDNVLNSDKNSKIKFLNIVKSTELNDTIVSYPCIPAAIILSPECDITVEEAQIIKTQLATYIQKTVVTGKDRVFSPSFENKPSLSDGALKIWCANEETYIWLRNTAANIPTTSSEFKLEVIKQVDLPKKIIIQLFVPEYKNGDIEYLLQLLKQQNSWYNIDAWTLYDSQHMVASEEIKKQFQLDDDIKEGMLLWFGISKKEECKIRDRRGLVSYLLESIQISHENVGLGNIPLIASHSVSS